MRTNIDIDDQLMIDAMRVFGVSTKKEAVDAVMWEAIRIRQQSALMELWGIGWDGDLDDMRTSKHSTALE